MDNGDSGLTKAQTCFLCGSDRHSIADELTAGQLKNLWRCLGRTFRADAWPAIPDHAAVRMYRCDDCGFLFFDPLLAGNEAFYQALEQPGYFSPFRDEFQRTLRFGRGRQIKRILDVGCGSGIFLDIARQAGLEASGVDLNSRAAGEARRKGHQIFERLLSDLSPEQTGGKFDMITLFQVLEHVSDPAKTVREAKELLRDGGFIAIAVPSARGINRLAPHDPSQWPPHHLSLWRLVDFTTLARATRMTLLESGGDMLLGSAIEMRWNLRNQLATVLGNPALPGGKAAPQLLSLIYRKLGLKFVFPRWGSSIYAYLQKQ